MVLVSMSYRVKSGKLEESVQTFNRIFDIMIHAVGHDHSHLYQLQGDHCEFLVVSQWRTAEDFEQFAASQEFIQTECEHMRGLLDGVVVRHVYDPVEAAALA